MSAIDSWDSWRDGVRRVGRSPAIIVGVWLLTVALALPLAVVLRGMLAEHLGSSVAADSAAAGVNYDWMQEFSGQASGIGVTFGPAVIGFAAVLDNLSAIADRIARPPVIAGAAAAYMLGWIFLAGGIIDRYARDRATRAAGFFAAAGVFFFRFLRLAVVQAIAYAILFNPVYTLLFARVYPRLTHDMTVERNAFLVRLVLYAVFGGLLAAFTLAFDYAKVRAVVEDRRSMLGALAAGIRFVRHNPGALGLYALNTAVFVACLAAYALVAPGVGGAGWSMWLAFGIGQLYIAARLVVKLVFWASEVALFQSRLAHAGYVAAPEFVWPDSPAADAITYEERKGR